MSSENVEIVETAFAAFNESGVDGILRFIHPEFEFTTPPELASEPDTYSGHEGVRRYFGSFYEVMDEIRWDSHGLREVGERVVVEFTLRARGKTVGLDLFPTLDEALEAVGQGASS